jgi:hypothetical protein
LKFSRTIIHIDKTKSPDAQDFALLICLCNSFFAGFEVNYSEKRGAPRKWDVARYCTLLADIEEIKSEKKCGDIQAFRIYLMRKIGARPREGDAETLTTRLSEARSPQFNMFARFFLDDDPEFHDYMLDVFRKRLRT